VSRLGPAEEGPTMDALDVDMTLAELAKKLGQLKEFL
jgi:hypothetical protein